MMPSSLKQAPPVDTLRGMHLHPALPESIDELKTLLLAQSAQLAQMHAVISERDWLKQSGNNLCAGTDRSTLQD